MPSPAQPLSIQIYFDFSGYSDMAIGLGRMFGFTFPENFKRPYSALMFFPERWAISPYLMDVIDLRILAAMAAGTLLFFFSGQQSLGQRLSNEMQQKSVLDEPLYARTDTHYTHQGALVFAEALIDGIQPGTWDKDAIVYKERPPRSRDLTSLAGLTSTKEPFTSLFTVRPKYLHPIVCSLGINRFVYKQ